MNKLLQIKDIVTKFIKENKTIVLRILAVIIIIVTILVIISAVKEDEVGNSAGNLIANHGISAEAGKWIYYMAFDDNEPFGIYRVKKNGQKTDKIIEGYYEYINVSDKYIYCLEKDEYKNEYNLVKIKKNGKNKETLAKNVDYAPVTASGNRVYYFKDDSFYSIKTNGSDKVKIVSKDSKKDIKYYEICDNKIYYIYEYDGNSYMAKMKLNGENNIKIGKLEKSEYVSLHVKNNKVYYVICDEDDNYQLYKMKKNGEKEEKIYNFGESIETINMQDDAVYYVVKDGEYKISTINYKAGNKGTIKKVQELEAFGISGKWVFYVEENSDDEIVIERIKINGEKQQSL